MVSMAFLREQIISQGRGAHPLKGAFRYDLNDDMEIVIGNMPNDPDGLNWSQLQTIVNGLWEYIVTGMRYRTVSFDILNVENDAQIAWGQLVKWEAGSPSDQTAKRGVQLSSLSGDLDSGQHNSSLSNALGRPIFWPIRHSDMTLRFSTYGGGPQDLDRTVTRDLFIDLTRNIDHEIEAHGVKALVNAESFRYGRSVVLEIINWQRVLTWGDLATVVLGLIDFMVDHGHYRSWYFAIFVQNPKVEIALGIVSKDLVLQNNVTVARRRSFRNGVGVGAG